MKLFHQKSVLFIVAFAAISASSRALAWTASRAPWAGVVTYVVDGDTLQVRPTEGGKPVSIRIDGIDAPEICQPGGAISRNALMRKLLGKRVLVYSKVHDAYDRLVARLILNGEDQGRWMVAHGLATVRGDCQRAGGRTLHRPERRRKQTHHGEAFVFESSEHGRQQLSGADRAGAFRRLVAVCAGARVAAG